MAFMFETYALVIGVVTLVIAIVFGVFVVGSFLFVVAHKKRPDVRQ